jgi:RNA polymerase sigma-70 factor (ECF subfamily)
VALACGSRAAAEDAVQEALARAWERSERGEQFESLRAWVMKVAINLVRSGYRRMRAERRARERAAARGDLDLAGGQPTIAGSEQAMDVARALATLPRRQREATVLRYYMDLSVLEVAAVLGVNEGTAKTTLFRARKSLARVLGEPAIVDESEEANGLARP